MASVVRGIVKSIKDKGIGSFWRELKEEGYLYYFPALFFFLIRGFFFFLIKSLEES